MVQLFKPAWVTHEDSHIFSIDVHPDGTRFVTGGQDGRVRIWSVGPVRNESDNSPRLLCTLTTHQAAVNSVRWSPNGKYLASASDDKTIAIWELRSERGGVVFGTNERIVEQWRCVGILRSHESDVTDICWSPDSTKIASCGIDNFVIIWDVPTFSLLKKLQGHNSLIKGIAWDPIGRYIISQSDDRTAIIWRVADFSIEKQLTEPFKRSTSHTFFKRPSFSPDGQYICAACGVKDERHIAPILSRAHNFECRREFVGHTHCIVCTKWNPKLWKNPKDKHPDSVFLVCAIGSKDTRISLWATNKTRAVILAENLFTASVVDLAWTPDGFGLFACSVDGTVAFLEFDSKELGVQLTPQEFENSLKLLYGEVRMQSTSGKVVEDPLLLVLERERKRLLSSGTMTANLTADDDGSPPQLITPTTDGRVEKVSLTSTPLAPSSASSLPLVPLATSTPQLTTSTATPQAEVTETNSNSQTFNTPSGVVQQIVTTLPSGKRRITPQLVGTVGTTPLSGFVAATNVLSSSGGNVATPTELPSSVTSRLLQNAQSTEQTNSTPTSHTAQLPVSSAPLISTPPPISTPPQKQTPISSQPQSSISPSPALSQSQPQPQPQPQSQPQPQPQPQPQSSQSSLQIQTPSQSSTKTISTPLRSTTKKKEEPKKRKHKQSDDEKETRPRKKNKTKRREDEHNASQKINSPQRTSKSFEVLLSVPQPTDRIVKRLFTSDVDLTSSEVQPSEVYLEASVSQNTSGESISLITCVSTLTTSPSSSDSLAVSPTTMTTTTIRWQDRLKVRATILAGNQNFAAVGCSDGTLVLYTTSGGRRLLPCLALGHPLSFLEANKTFHLLAVTSDGTLRLWNMRHQTDELTTSVLALVTRDGVTIDRVQLTDIGQIFIFMSNLEAFMWHTTMKVWVRIADNHFLGSAYRTTLTFGAKGPLQQIQLATTKATVSPTTLLNMSATEQSFETIAHLENQIACSIAVGSVPEFRHWLHTYVQKLVQDTNVSKLEALCEELLGPPSRLSNVPPKPTDTWNPTILGLNKRQLLRELLALMSSNLNLQRLISKFREALVVVTQRETEFAKSSSHLPQALSSSSTPSPQPSQEPKANERLTCESVQAQEPSTQDKINTEENALSKRNELICVKEIHRVSNTSNTPKNDTRNNTE
jgi:protein HIRA/HIR1